MPTLPAKGISDYFKFGKREWRWGGRLLRTGMETGRHRVKTVFMLDVFPVGLPTSKSTE